MDDPWAPLALDTNPPSTHVYAAQDVRSTPDRGVPLDRVDDPSFSSSVSQCHPHLWVRPPVMGGRRQVRHGECDRDTGQYPGSGPYGAPRYGRPGTSSPEPHRGCTSSRWGRFRGRPLFVSLRRPDLLTTDGGPCRVTGPQRPLASVGERSLVRVSSTNRLVKGPHITFHPRMVDILESSRSQKGKHELDDYGD